ncbi:hypothetical protein BSR29_07230 [Boudabousia liubingyangii]|uniref:DUF3800 domain-containing protein n=1 Tax=Boudabousia liubingyangii TaxID=1921764 RepID=A0A1Q5PK57_9ACTO|nr:DUF3800 domain-containing protein [Boudabousia liubingyangii]OKL46606.1 hypothetical protein BSR29_07230 [Boudabousia liubingyangii]
MIFIDDSGDGGFKFDKGSSQFLVMAACVFEDEEALKLLDEATLKARTALKKEKEFKYNKFSQRQKQIYFNFIKDVPFYIRVIYAEKAYIYSDALRQSPEALKSYLIKMLLTHNYGEIRNADIYIDGQDKRAFGIPGDKYFEYAAPEAIKSVQFIDSKTSSGIQLADMVAGAVNRCLSKKQTYQNACEDWKVLRSKASQPKGTFWDFCRNERNKETIIKTCAYPSEMNGTHTVG